MKRIGKRIAAFLLCLVLLAPAAAAYADNEQSVLDPDALQTMVEQYINENNLTADNVSVGYVYTETGDTWLYNEDQWYYAASCYKVPVMMLLAEKVHDGELTQDSEVAGLKLWYAEESVLIYSNNDYGHAMMRYLGNGDETQCTRLYQKYSDMPTEEFISDYYDYRYYNVHFLTDVMKTLYADPERFPNIIDCLLQANPDEWIHGGFGDRYEVAQKYGSYQEADGDYYNNTAAIVYMPHPVIMVVMTLGLDSIRGQHVIQGISGLLEQYTLALDEKLEQEAEAERLAAEEAARQEAEAQQTPAEQIAEEAPAETAAPETPVPVSEEPQEDARRPVALWLIPLLVILAAALAAVVLLLRNHRKTVRRKVRRRQAADDWYDEQFEADEQDEQQASDEEREYVPRH